MASGNLNPKTERDLDNLTAPVGRHGDVMRTRLVLEFLEAAPVPSVSHHATYGRLPLDGQRNMQKNVE